MATDSPVILCVANFTFPKVPLPIVFLPLLRNLLQVVCTQLIFRYLHIRIFVKQKCYPQHPQQFVVIIILNQQFYQNSSMRTNAFQGPVKAPLNTSGVQNAFSFSKNRRFSAAQELLCKTSYYDKNQPFNTRSTSFGIGNRTRAINNTENPSPDKYDAKVQSKSRKGFTFSHNKKISFVDEQSKLLQSNPGPTKYQKTILGKTQSFSFRSKYEDPFQRQKNKLGPGQYNLSGLITQRGFYSESKHKGSACRKIGRQKRFGSDQTPPPGPGQYKDQLGLDPIGNYFNSRIPSKGIRTFGKPVGGQLFYVNPSPGPGSYYHFAQFPDYLSKKY